MGVTRLEIVGLLGKAFVLFPLNLLLNCLRIWLISRQRRLPFRSYLTIAGVRTFLTTFSPREIQTILPSTGSTKKRWTERQAGSPPLRSSALETSQGTIHWISVDPEHIDDDSKLILFFHGGGYAVPLNNAHLDWCSHHIEIGNAKGLRIGAAILEYTLCPGAHYPKQLQQAADALNHVLRLGFRPEQIVIGGDSAGGNLTFSLLGHLLHPHPEVGRVDLTSPLSGVFGISPWVTNRMDTTSYKENATADMLSPSLVIQSRDDFLPPTANENTSAPGAGRAMPLDVSPEWWVGVEKCVRRIYLNAGRHEMMRDHILEFAETLRHQNGDEVKITVDVGQVEAHDHILVDYMNSQRDGRSFWALMMWMFDSFELNR